MDQTVTHTIAPLIVLFGGLIIAFVSRIFADSKTAQPLDKGIES